MASQSPDTRDKFDLTQSAETWAGFVTLSKWVVIVSLIIVVLMAFFLTGSDPAP